MNPPKRILVVEDDADDRELLLDAVAEQQPQVEIAVAENGLQALEYLATAVRDGNRPPCLIVLDLNMPFLDGRGTFERIRNDADLRNIPVIIFTSSLNPNDRAHFTSLGAEFISKPTSRKVLSEVAAHMVRVCCP